jgi:hypothetical protein
MDLRAGSPAAERRTRSRSLRGTILARPTPSCAHDDDRIRLPPASPPRNSKTGKKESTGRRPSRLCRPFATPSSNSSLEYRRGDARIAENGFATSSGVNKNCQSSAGSCNHKAEWPKSGQQRSNYLSRFGPWLSSAGPSDSRSRAARCPASTQLNRSQADWRDIPNAAPICAQLTSRDRRISTTCCSWLPLPWMVSSIG